ncbi:M4 family metallopeptidase [Chryseobacterium wanjuense]
MKKSFIPVKALAFAIAFIITPISLLQAQHRKDNTEISVQNLPRISKTSAMGSFHANFSGQNITSSFLINHLGEWLGTDSDHSFKFVKESTDELGIKHLVYQHYFKGIKVGDEIILIHEKNGMLTYVNGEISDKINVPVGNTISEMETEKIAALDMKAEGKTSFSNYEQLIAKVNTERGAELHSVSKIEAFSLKPLNAFVYYIDNTTKNIVKKIEKSYKADFPSNSMTFYKGVQPITVDSYNGSYRLKDNARNIHTLDATNLDGNYDLATGELTGAVEYTNTTPDFTAANTKPAVEVQWAMEKSHDYYVNKHARNSYDGNGSIIRNYYNVDFHLLDSSVPAGFGMNAAAIDASGIVCMVYGNGAYPPYPSGVFANPVVGIDVAGHEYSHLIIGRNGLGGLNYEGESGAINESIADMMGAAIEFYSGINPNWTIGEGIINGPLSLQHISEIFPILMRRSVLLGGQQPDTYMGTYWKNTANPTAQNDWGGVHTNSGVGIIGFIFFPMEVREQMILEMHLMLQELVFKKQKRLFTEHLSLI